MSKQLPSWLPSTIGCDPWSSETYEMLYTEFKRSLKGKLSLDGKRVWFFPEKVDGKEAIFWHLTTRKDIIVYYDNKGRKKYKDGERLPDLPRCDKLHWVRAIIENCNHPDVLFWDYQEDKGTVNTYLWL